MKPYVIIPDSAVDYCPFRHSRMLQAGIQEVRNAWMPASAGMIPLFPETVSSSHLARVSNRSLMIRHRSTAESGIIKATWLLIGWVWLTASIPAVYAQSLQKSDLGSTLEPQCDLCWYPSPNEERSDRLPTYKQPRHKRPPDSRPQRYPKGRYKLGPEHKQSRLSTLRTRSRHELKVLSNLQVRTIDGDTIRVGGERIRLRGIDTPELSEFDGPAAKRRLEELLRNGEIRIVPHGRDVYNRLLADVFVNEQNVAETLIMEGYEKPRS